MFSRRRSGWEFINSQNLLKPEDEYGSTASVNNGNVTKQTTTVPGVAHPFIQTYAYDELKRLKSAEETRETDPRPASRPTNPTATPTFADISCS